MFVEVAYEKAYSISVQYQVLLAMFPQKSSFNLEHQVFLKIKQFFRILFETPGLRKMRLKASSVKWRPFCLDLNTLILNRAPGACCYLSEYIRPIPFFLRDSRGWFDIITFLPRTRTSFVEERNNSIIFFPRSTVRSLIHSKSRFYMLKSLYCFKIWQSSHRRIVKYMVVGELQI